MALFIAFTIWLAASGLFAAPDAEVNKEVWSLVAMVILVLCFAVVARRLGRHEVHAIFVLLILVALLFLIVGFALGPGNQSRISVPGGGPNVYVRVMGIGALASIYAASKTGRRVWLLLVPPFVLGALLSGSRGGLIALVTVLIFMVLPTARRRINVNFAQAVVGSALGVIALLQFVDDTVRSALRNRFVERTVQDRYVSGRDRISEAAVQIFIDNQATGAGIGTVKAEVGFHAHNLFLSTASEAGLVGLALLGLALGAIIVPLLRSRPLSLEASSLGGLSALIFLSSMFSGYYYDTRLGWVFGILALVLRSPDSSSDARLGDGTTKHVYRNANQVAR